MIKSRLINLQLFAEEAATEELPPGTFKWFDPQAKKEIFIPEKVGEIDMKVILGHVTSGVRKAVSGEIESKYKSQLDELKSIVSNKDSNLAEFQEKLQKFEDEKLTQEERTKKEIDRERNKYITENKKFQDESIAWQTRFKDSTIDNAILGALPANVYNASQTMLLVKNLLKPEVVQTERGFETMLSLTVDGVENKYTPKEAIELFLAMPGNEHHLKNNLLPGAGSSKSGARVGSGGFQYKKSDLSNNPKLRAEYFEKMKNGEPVAIIE